MNQGWLPRNVRKNAEICSIIRKAQQPPKARCGVALSELFQKCLNPQGYSASNGRFMQPSGLQHVSTSLQRSTLNLSCKRWSTAPNQSVKKRHNACVVVRTQGESSFKASSPFVHLPQVKPQSKSNTPLRRCNLHHMNPVFCQAFSNL